MIINHPIINNLNGSMFALCLMALSGFPDATSTKIEILEGISLFHRIFQINITDEQEQKNLTLAEALQKIAESGILCDIFLPLIERAAIAFLGFWIFAFLGNHYGRKLSLMVTSLLAIGFYTGKLVNDWFIMEILSSFTTMGVLLLVYTYISEISPTNIRGVLITLPGTMIIPRYIYDEYLQKYRHQITLTVLIVTVAVVFVFCEESPYFYLFYNQNDLAFRNLSAFRAGNLAIDAEIKEMQDDIMNQKVMTVKEFLITFKMGIKLLIFQWFAIANAIILISSYLYQSVIESADYPILIPYIVIVTPILSLLLVEKFDRKYLLSVTTLGMILFYSIWCLQNNFNLVPNRYIKCVSLILFTVFEICHNSGIGTLIWVILSEIYPTTKRIYLLGISLLLTVYFSFAFILPFLVIFVVLLSCLPVAGFLSMIVLWAVFFYSIKYRLWFVETRGKSLLVIQNEIMRRG